MSEYPIVILQDRYSGVYSRGDWLAVACADDRFDDARSRLDFVLSAADGPSRPDPDAASFWQNPPERIASGNTPDEALFNLRNPPK